jgi:hypothetical protein
VFLSFWQVEPGSSDDALALQEEEESEDELTSSFIDPDDVNFLRSLDPKEWKVSLCYFKPELNKCQVPDCHSI